MKLNELIIALLFIILIFGFPIYRISQGYSIKYSWINGKWVWVDKDGKP